MNKENKHCYMCRDFSRYYTKGAKRFDKTEFGWCCERRESVNIHYCCDKWKGRLNRRKINGLTKLYLNDILTEISTIRMIIEEENCNDDENENL